MPPPPPKPRCHACPVCGQVLAGPPAPCPNRWCRRPDRGVSVAYAIGAYQGSLRRLIGRYKYGGERHLAPVLASVVAGYLAAHPAWFEEFEVIAAVPAYTGPGARRPWDPAGAVLAALPERLGPGWSVEPGLVEKTGETPAMAGRDWFDRQAIARGQLRASLAVSRSLAGTQVLLLDDVLTEGSTLREVARALRRAGASDVAGLVLARRAWQPQPPGRIGPI